MSTALGIASVTAVLRDLLINGLLDHDLTPALGDVRVTALPPDRVVVGDQEQSQLNLFLYQATPNASWRNADLPTRSSTGTRISNHPLALDLHYLVTAYGARDLHSEILLGYAMQLLHENPVLDRDGIRAALSPPPLVASGGGLPAAMETLSTSELAEQVELIKISPQVLSPEEISRLWTALQARYRATAAYQVSVVLIDSRAPRASSLPVLQRGEEDRGVDAQAGLRAAQLDEILLPHRQSSAFLGDAVVLRGRYLAGTIAVRFAHIRRRDFFDLPLSFPATENELRLALTPGQLATFPDGTTAAAPWIPGPYSVSAVQVRNGRRWTSAPRPLAISPRIDSIAPPNPVARDASGQVLLTLTVSPPILVSSSGGGGVRFAQAVELLLGARGTATPEAPTVAPGTATQGQLDFRLNFRGDETGDYLPRLRVDGVEMPVVDWTARPPRFDESKKLTIV